ncbi:hypothetical protein [Ideonella sp. A 288]|nr:hypothetical protein [Ideonella sp. A 288]
MHEAYSAPCELSLRHDTELDVHQAENVHLSKACRAGNTHAAPVLR